MRLSVSTSVVQSSRILAHSSRGTITSSCHSRSLHWPSRHRVRCLLLCTTWVSAPHEGITLKDRASEFGLNSGEHEVMVVYKMRSHLPRAFGEREAVLPDVERVEVMPKLAWADLARFRIALTEGDCESRMQLLRDLGYKDWGHVEGARYVLTARIGAGGSFFSDGSSLID